MSGAAVKTICKDDLSRVGEGDVHVRGVSH